MTANEALVRVPFEFELQVTELCMWLFEYELMVVDCSAIRCHYSSLHVFFSKRFKFYLETDTECLVR